MFVDITEPKKPLAAGKRLAESGGYLLDYKLVVDKIGEEEKYLKSALDRVACNAFVVNNGVER